MIEIIKEGAKKYTVECNCCGCIFNYERESGILQKDD